MAEQMQPVRRKVAFKIIKPGMDTRLVVARFEAERQALALMDHPNIARVFDGGATETGRPYFVMELVHGIPITEFCDENRLPIRDRIELFVAVCKAVQHAHQKGIIHRDLKPSNVLVTLHDDKPVVKVIDFGIAKAIGQQLTEKTLFTNFAQMIGTPLYMSPEQAQLSGLDVDTRSDIYAMGVLLYELLTGTTPFDQERLRTLAFDEFRRMIHEEEPPRPSSRLTSGDEATTTASFKRRSDPRRLSQLIRGELDWIVMKCLEKDRNRRYETANGLATDLARYLNNEPVQACPPSLWYRARMFVRRHRASIGTAASLLAIALIGAALTVWQAIQAAAARDAENQARLALSKSKQADAEERANEIARQLETLNKANSLIESARSHVDFAEWDKAEADLNQALVLAQGSFLGLGHAGRPLCKTQPVGPGRGRLPAGLHAARARLSNIALSPRTFTSSNARRGGVSQDLRGDGDAIRKGRRPSRLGAGGSRTRLPARSAAGDFARAADHALRTRDRVEQDVGAAGEPGNGALSRGAV